MTHRILLECGLTGIRLSRVKLLWVALLGATLSKGEECLVEIDRFEQGEVIRLFRGRVGPPLAAHIQSFTATSPGC